MVEQGSLTHWGQRRNKVGNEWKESMGRVKEDHTGVRQALLSKRWDPSDSNDSRDDTAAFQ
jgi:hypothetical protein